MRCRSAQIPFIVVSALPCLRFISHSIRSSRRYSHRYLYLCFAVLVARRRKHPRCFSQHRERRLSKAMSMVTQQQPFYNYNTNHNQEERNLRINNVHRHTKKSNFLLHYDYYRCCNSSDDEESDVTGYHDTSSRRRWNQVGIFFWTPFRFVQLALVIDREDFACVYVYAYASLLVCTRPVTPHKR